jgi:hypothetical protein
VAFPLAAPLASCRSCESSTIRAGYSLPTRTGREVGQVMDRAEEKALWVSAAILRRTRGFFLKFNSAEREIGGSSKSSM